ncbi:NADH dehydrogenase 1 alpha subcomplex assembly factor 3 [Chytridium lagenaria]|nr:NADH dehydrogenase 1 alpha subcomplex assembly factor 3 [Chytridium lagenaria]
MVRSVGNWGFTVNDLSVNGGIILLNNSVLLWDTLQFGIGSKELMAESAASEAVVDDPSSVFHNWSRKELNIFELVQPKPEILVIGTGAQMHALPQLLRTYILSLGIQLEVLPSRQAGSTYNVLLQEGRTVAAAMLPVVPTSARTGLPLVTLTNKPAQ